MCKADPRFKLYDQLPVDDAIPHFKDTPFNLTTLVDFNRDATLDPANWITTPVDNTPLKGIESRKRGLNQRGNHTTNNGSPKVIRNNKSSDPRNTTTTITAPKQGTKHVGQLIKSGSQYHSASELCGSATSYGPDFVSIHEGIFCDMDQKKVWPICKMLRIPSALMTMLTRCVLVLEIVDVMERGTCYLEKSTRMLSSGEGFV